ncbi:MAG: hypothetical protein ACD_68C00128G0002 [uncultured bacterium]|nr:MAG: hypothetical protein ACD_68C00128G0002 [uncultured bacterium]
MTNKELDIKCSTKQSRIVDLRKIKEQIDKPIAVFEKPASTMVSVSSEVRLDYLKHWQKKEKAPLPFFYSRKSIVVFLAVLLIFPGLIKFSSYINDSLISQQGAVLGEAEKAWQNLKMAAGSVGDRNFENAAFQFDLAAEGFQDARTQITKVNVLARQTIKLIPGSGKLTSAENLLAAGVNFSVAGEYLSRALNPFSNMGDALSGVVNQNINEKIKPSITENILLARSYLEIVAEKVNLGITNIEKVDAKDVPENMQPQIKLIKDELPKLKGAVNSINQYLDSFLNILGHQGKKRYLLLFVNNREVRKGGGFIGTYGLLDIEDGKITKLFVEEPYNVDGQLTKKITAPAPLALINPQLYMRDANFFLDYPTSAKKVAELYEASGGVTVDGVITLTAQIMPALLEITGPIEMPEYNTTISADNFYDQTQNEVEYEYDKELNKPKKFIADLLPIMLDRITNLPPEKTIKILDALFSGLSSKDIMLYFNDEDLQKQAASLGYAGIVPDPPHDFLAVAESNIGGGKTSDVIEQEINHLSLLQKDGSIIDSLTIKRTHQGSPENQWQKIKNVSYLEIFVPLGSTLMEAKGFDSGFFTQIKPADPESVADPLIAANEKNKQIDRESSTVISRESNQTTFGNWVGLVPGESREITIQYRLPMKINLTSQKVVPYSLYIFKQSGTPPAKITSEISWEGNYQAVWNYSSLGNPEIANSTFKTAGSLTNDRISALVLERK